MALMSCSLLRLFILGSYDRETYVHCTFELSEKEWREKTRTSIKTVSLNPLPLLPVKATCPIIVYLPILLGCLPQFPSISKLVAA